ncbi:MAG: hypothetical protein HA488_02000 [Candidatus Verstraetearchaeota archaeon]|nr:hypothetical protein [Candidatus Verstraetearchaeota archaeon]
MGLMVYIFKFIKNALCLKEKILMSITFSLIAIAIFFALTKTYISPLYYMSPIIIYYISWILHDLPNHKNISFIKILVNSFIIFVVFVGLLAPHSYVLFSRYVYDPTIKNYDAGLSMPSSIYLGGFVNTYVGASTLNRIIADTYDVYAFLDTRLYNIVDRFSTKTPEGTFMKYNEHNIIIVSLIHFNHFSSAEFYRDYYNDLVVIKSRIDSERAKILDAICYNIYYNP